MGGVPDRIESLREVERSKNRSRTMLNPIHNGLRKKQVLIESRSLWAETGPAGRKSEIRFQKKSKRDRMIRSKSFATQDGREIGRKEVGESRDFCILCEWE